MVHIPHNVLNRVKRMVNMRRVMHSQNNTCDNLCHQAERQNTAKCPPVIQVFRRWIVNKTVMRQP